VSNLIDITEIAERLKVPRNYVRDKLVKNGSFPPPAISLSQRIRRWEESAVQEWIEQQKQEQAR
jgi:predicted DNA-binding transcriptional regulator AlpA